MTRQHLLVRLASRFAVAAFGCAVVIPGIRAQSPPTRNGRQPPHNNTAVSIPTPLVHVRFWKTDLRAFSNLRVTMTLVSGASKTHPITHDLGSGGPGYIFNSYADVPSGHGTINVFDLPAGGSPVSNPAPLANLPVDFAPGSFITVLLDEPWKAGGPPRLEVITDSVNDQGGEAMPAQITVRSFVAGLKELRVSLGDTLNAQFANSSSYLQMRGLRSNVYPVRTVGTSMDGKPFEWNNEADLRVHSHQTLLVYPDPYGRIRPRLVVDGESGSEPPTDKEGQR